MTASLAPTRSVETRESWVVATVALCILGLSYGAPLATVVALEPIATTLGTDRSAPALAVAMTYIGAGGGGIFMGWLSQRIGVRAIVISGGTMIGVGMAFASSGGIWRLALGNLLLVGLLGASGMFAPLMAYVSMWFDRRRGSAVALISSGQYIAGAVWPSLFELSIQRYGWRHTMFGFGCVVTLLIVPLAAIFLRRPPAALPLGTAHPGPRRSLPSLGLPPNVICALLGLAAFCCCVTMSIPMAHMVAYCTDIGLGPVNGAAMLSVLLGTAFFARQFWGWLADRIGGLQTVLWASAGQAVAMSGFLLTQNEIGLYTVSAAFGLGFAGLIPGYVLTVREMFPASEAGWRIPVVLFPGSLGMAAGGWLAGVIYDHFAYYEPAFAAGVLFNLFNLAVIGPMVLRGRSLRLLPAAG
ncbi:MAG TPA: MFS transporter [Acetobacteraceae bacterium]|jgi:MFS family permease